MVPAPLFPRKLTLPDLPPFFTRQLVRKCPSFQKDYRPPAWAVGAWAQAIIYTYRAWRNQHLRGFFREVRYLAKRVRGPGVVPIDTASSCPALHPPNPFPHPLTLLQLVELPDGEFVSLLWMLPPGNRKDIPSPHRTRLDGADTSTSPCTDQDSPTICFDSLGDRVSPDVPVILVCHGVFQNASDLYELCTFLTERCGYAACVFNRRGNDLPLSQPR